MMNWLYLATGFTGAWTLHFVWQQVLRLFVTPPAVDVHISNGADCLDLLLSALKRARREVLVLARAMHAPPVAMALVAAKLRKVQVEILLDPACERDQASDLPLLQDQGVQPLTIAPDAISMGAVIVIDGREVFCGGFTSGAELGPDSTVDLLHIKGHPDVVLAYRQHFTNEKLNARPAVVRPKTQPPLSTGFKGYNTPGSPPPAATTEAVPAASRQFPPVQAGRTMPAQRNATEAAEQKLEREPQTATATLTPPSRPAPQSLERSLEPNAVAASLSTSAAPVRQPRPVAPAEPTLPAAAMPARPENVPVAAPTQATERPASALEGTKSPATPARPENTPVAASTQTASLLLRTMQAAAAPPRQTSQPVAPQEKKTPAPTPLPPRTSTPATPPTVVPQTTTTPAARETPPPTDSTASKSVESPAPVPKTTATTTPATGAASTKAADNSNLTPLQRKLAALGVNIANNPGGV